MLTDFVRNYFLPVEPRRVVSVVPWRPVVWNQGNGRKFRPEARGRQGERAFVRPAPSSQSHCRTHRGQWTLIPLRCPSARTEGSVTSETGRRQRLAQGTPGVSATLCPQILPRKGNERQNSRKSARGKPEGQPGSSPRASGVPWRVPALGHRPRGPGTQAVCDPARQR